MQQMKAARMYGIDEVRIDEIPVPQIKVGEVLIKMKSVGVCGSDVHYYKEGRIGDYVVEPPLVLGHECAGEIVEVADDVKTFKPGDRVAIEPGYTCRKCIYCKTGRYNLCPDVYFLATPPIDGAYVEYLAWPADFAFALPDNMTYDHGALMEPLAVGMHAVRRSRLKPGEPVLVLGAGTIGLVTILSAKAAGAGEIIVADLEDVRLNMAKTLGATKTINASRENTLEIVKDMTGGFGMEVVFETAGSMPTTQQTIDLAARGGRIVWVGLAGQSEFPIQVIKSIDKELDILGIFRYANVYPYAIQLVSTGRMNIDPLVTHRYPLEQVGEALDVAHERRDGAVKVMVDIES
ncbi:alcohol dehydrogenase catalytic domain-containing protein [candidate division KSB3 bacterium]|uniref:Alcohol dehydrogenase catalytic domain-containing protein n=1 Tax=candidate division KSB3 bacterium TaxID=2044937 RepID=A0A9D5JWV1_9BACT|nr:alcohol dehydrogenase catalytic domain-containing protein [candidate division KSB3 bacterium]MBD3325196.1 alcohol dehydrogenase catalytic domain-containing protein [candidate division KSB3 bacterium]